MSEELDAAIADYKEKRRLADVAERTSYDAQIYVEVVREEDRKKEQERKRIEEKLS
jgi:hypothetical protein